LTTKRIDDTSYRGRCPLADEVKIQHPLASSWLQSIDEGSGLWMEESVLRWWRPRPRWSSETTNIVISGGASGGWRKGRHFSLGIKYGYKVSVGKRYSQYISFAGQFLELSCNCVETTAGAFLRVAIRKDLPMRTPDQ